MGICAEPLALPEAEPLALPEAEPEAADPVSAWTVPAQSAPASSKAAAVVRDDANRRSSLRVMHSPFSSTALTGGRTYSSSNHSAFRTITRETAQKLCSRYYMS